MTKAVLGFQLECELKIYIIYNCYHDGTSNTVFDEGSKIFEVLVKPLSIRVTASIKLFTMTIRDFQNKIEDLNLLSRVRVINQFLRVSFFLSLARKTTTAPTRSKADNGALKEQSIFNIRADTMTFVAIGLAVCLALALLAVVVLLTRLNKRESVSSKQIFTQDMTTHH